MAITNPVKQATTMLSQVELLRRIDPNGNIADIAEVLNETNEILKDVTFKEGNLVTGDEQTVRTGLPDVYWRQLNRGIPSSHSTTATVTETCAEMGARSTLDVRVAQLNGMSAQFRRSEETPFIESMGQKLAQTLMYGNVTKKVAEGFTGFAKRYSSLSAANGKNIIDAGGTDNLTSIYVVAWGDNVYCPYPKGSKLGLQTRDLGEQLIDDDLGQKFLAYVTDYSWQVGLMVRDWRYVARIANIDSQAIKTGTGAGTGDIQKTGTNLIMMIQEALSKIPSAGSNHLAIYMNNDVHYALNVIAHRTNSNVLAWHEASDAYGSNGAWTSFEGVPLRRVDQIVNTETKVA